MSKELEALNRIKKNKFYVLSHYEYDNDTQSYGPVYEKADGLTKTECFKIIRQTLLKHKQLEKDLGCPLDAVIKLINAKRIIRDDGVVFGFIGINFNDENKLILYNDDECNTFTSDLRLADYKKTWWLKKDKSE